MNVEARQITFGPKHHFFGYIGHCQTIPWSGNGRYILCLETESQDRMPGPAEAAKVLVIDALNNEAPKCVDESRGWNPQQGTMFYWNPQNPETQFFFNDRDPITGKVFTVLYDIEKWRRLSEYRFDDTPVANAGVAPSGGEFLAINYGRLARLRPVTGYPGSYDWTVDNPLPEDDGIFKIHVATAEKQLICSYPAMIAKLLETGKVKPGDDFEVFLNHTLWNRESDLVMFYLRSGPFWGSCGGNNLNEMFTMRPDGSELTCHGTVGGHPEWAPGSKIIAEGDNGLRLYDPFTREDVGILGDQNVFFDPKGDKALSPDATLLVHGNGLKRDDGQYHEYVIFRISDGHYVRSPLFRRGPYTEGPLRLDPSPCWNRSGNQVLVPGIADDGTRQLFICPSMKAPTLEVRGQVRASRGEVREQG